MRIESLTVHLRERTSWEAMELGMALVRRHAAAIWKPWCLIVLPVFVMFNALGWALDLFWLTNLLLWWLKPVFDRIPLYVISRAVFGTVPNTRETVRAQAGWGWKPMLHYLTWRRFSPARSLYLPVDLLEGVDGQRVRERRRVLGSAVYGNAAMLTIMCLHFELALFFGTVAAVLLFVPLDLLPDALRTTWQLLMQQMPGWFLIAINAAVWLGISIMEPFFVGAGFGLYLNRRTQLEAWDVEIVFRKLRNRLAASASTLVLLAGIGMALGVGLSSAPVLAQESHTHGTSQPPQDDVVADEDEAAVDDEHEEATDSGDSEASDDETPASAEDVFADHHVDDRRFREAVSRAYADPSLNRTRVQKSWERRDKKEPEPEEPSNFDMPWLQSIAGMFAFLGEWGLWILVGILVVILLVTARYWWPWMRGATTRRPRFDCEVTTEAVVVPESLPDDVATVAQRLWREGRARDALALLYRAAVQTMSRQLAITLPPGATEAECLRTSRRLPQLEDRQLFARVVRVWQYAAYAQRLPADDEFDGLIAAMRERAGWLR